MKNLTLTDIIARLVLIAIPVGIAITYWMKATGKF